MTTNVDNRVVQMQFNNRDFEKGISTSMSSLDKLKQKLNLSGASKGLNDINKSAKSVSLDALAKSIEGISSRFSTMGIIGTTALVNLANSAVNAGKRMVAALTIDPIKTGFSEYETKMNSIKTILSNTKAKGSTLESVNEALAELNEYSDKTIYNFAQMTDMVGKFSASSGELDSSVSIVKGMANLAAYSGVDNQRLQSALYQTSQAMSGEYFQKIDWISLENSGLATEKFRNDLLAKAREMGTLDKVLDRNMKEGSVTFGGSLNEGWLTKEVFAAVTGMYALDEAMTASAGEVTTFTKLWDVMKESVQSGWAVSWEHIIGNKEQSTKLLTDISNAFNAMIQPSMQARNAMLEYWSAYGGRAAVIDGLTRTFKYLFEILKPVGEAFREVFPATTGKQLVEMSKNFREMTLKFKMGSDTAENLKSTFKGLFSVIDLGVKAIGFLLKAAGAIVSTFLPASGGILDITASFGDYLTALNNSLESTESFNKAFERFRDFISSAADKIKESFTGLFDGVNGIKVPDFTTLSSMSYGLSIEADTLETAGEKVKTSFEGFGKNIEIGFDILTKPFEGIWKFIKEAAGKIKTFIGDLIKNFDYEGAGDLLEKGALYTVGFFLIKFIKALSDFSSNAAKFIGSVTDVMDAVKDTLKAYQMELKANALIKLAIAIGILAVSIVLLSTVDANKLKNGLVGMAVLLGEVFAFLLGFSKTMGDKEFTSIGKVALSLIAISVALLILSSAMKKLEGIKWTDLAKGVVGIGAMVYALLEVSKIIDDPKNAKGMILAAFAMVVFSSAIRQMVKVVREMGEIDYEVMMKGLFGVATIIGMLGLFLKYTDLDGISFTKGLGIKYLAQALVIMTDAVQKFGEMNPEVLAQGLLAAAVALSALALSLTILSEMDNVAQAAVAIAIVSVSLLLLAHVLEKIGSLDIDVIMKGMIGIGGTLGIMAAALTLMQGTIAGSLALVIATLALAGLYLVMKLFGKLELEEIGKGLLVIAGVMAAVGLGSLLLIPAVPVIMLMAVAIGMMGSAMFLAGFGMTLFAGALATLAVSGTAAVVVLDLVIKKIADLIPYIATKLGEGIIAFAKAIGDASLELAESIGKVITAILNMVEKVIRDFIPRIIQLGVDLLLGLMKGISDNVGKLTSAAVDLILAFIKAITDQIPKIIDAAFKIIIAFVEGLTAAIENNTTDLITAMSNLVKAVVKAAKEGFTTSIKDFVSIGGDIVNGIIKGITDGVGALWDAAWNLGKKALGGLKKSIDSNSPSKEFGKLGEFASQGFAVGISKYSNIATKASDLMGKDISDSLGASMLRITDKVSGNIDMTPVIRPVLDLTDVEKGLKSTFSKTQNLELTGAVGRVSRMTLPGQNGSSINQTANSTSEVNIVINNTVRNDSDISKISRDLKTTVDRYNLSKGVGLAW